MKEYKNIHWIIIGDGRMRGWVEKEVISRGLSQTVHLIGRYPLESMPKFFSLADTLLVSLKRDELFSLTVPAKLQSYLACGKPILAALDGEGAAIVQESKSGFACSAGDSIELAQAVLTMYRLPKEERDKMGANGREYYLKHFERDMLVDRLQNWMLNMESKKKL